MSWSRSIEAMRPVLAAALLIVLAVPAKPEEKTACEQFKWPLAIERSWFEAGSLQDLQSGAAVDKLAEGAFTVSGVHGCTGLRKTVRFELKQAPLVLQLSTAGKVKIARAAKQSGL